MQVRILEHMSAWKSLRISVLVILLFVIVNKSSFAQSSLNDIAITVLFYNVENLFDTRNDPITDDDEFTPGGMRNWSSFRLHDKLNRISKVVTAAAGFDAPAIIGLCEVENRWVLEQLTEKTILSRFNYHIIHKDSPDERGIDVAMLFRPDKVTPLSYEYSPLISEGGDTLSSREILETVYQIGEDTLHVFVNHWPSRYRGQAETESDRMLAAKTLRKAVLAVYERDGDAKVVILGDFNDQPDDRSLKDGLLAVAEDDPALDAELVDLSGKWKPKGTLKHQNSWQIFDQIIVSDYLLEGVKLSTSVSDARIIDLPFLFETDERWGGKRLFRTYQGYQYKGGFSDHLPVLLKIRYNN